MPINGSDNNQRPSQVPVQTGQPDEAQMPEGPVKPVTTSPKLNQADHQQVPVGSAIENRQVGVNTEFPPDITKAQKQVNNLALQQSQIYSGMVLMHPSQAGCQGLNSANGLFYQQINGQPLVITSGGQNLPVHLMPQFQLFQDLFIQHQVQILAAMSHQMAQLQWQIQGMIQQLASMAVQAQLPPQQFLYLLPQPVMQPQPIALNTLRAFVHQPQPQYQTPCLPLGWQLQPNSAVIKGFPASQSHWIPGNAPLPALPQAPGFYFQPQPPSPKMMFQNPLLPYAAWMNWVNGGLHLPHNEFYNYISQRPPIYPGLQPPNNQPPVNLEQALKPFKEKINRLEKEIAYLRQQGNNEHSTQLAQLQMELAQLRKELAGKTANNSYLTGRLSELENQLEVIKAEKEAITKQKDQLANELRTLTAELQAANTGKQLSDEKLLELQHKFDELNKKAENDRHAKAFLKDKLERLQTQLQQLEQENSELKNKQLEYQAQINELKEQLAVMVVEGQAKSDTIKQLQQQLSDFEEQLLSRTLIEDDLEEKIKTLKAKVETLGEEKQALSKENKDLHHDIELLREKIGAQEAEIENLLAALNKAKDQNPSYGDAEPHPQIELLEQELEEAKEDIKKKEEQIEKLTKAADESESNNGRIQVLEEEIARLKAENKKQSTELKEKEAELVTLRAKNKELEEELKKLQSQLEVSDAKIAELTVINQELVDKLRTKDKQIDKLKTEIENLKKQLDDLSLTPKQKEELDEELKEIAKLTQSGNEEGLEKHNKKLKKRIETLEEANNDSEAELLKQLKLYDQLIKQHLLLQKQLELKEKEKEVLLDRLAHLEKKISESDLDNKDQQTISELRVRVINAIKKVINDEDNASDLGAIKDDIQETIDNIEDDETGKDNDQYKKLLQDLLDQVKTLQGNIEKESSEKKMLQQSLKDIESEKQSIEDSLNKLTEEKDIEKEKKEQLESAIKALAEAKLDFADNGKSAITLEAVSASIIDIDSENTELQDLSRQVSQIARLLKQSQKIHQDLEGQKSKNDSLKEDLKKSEEQLSRFKEVLKRKGVPLELIDTLNKIEEELASAINDNNPEQAHQKVKDLKATIASLEKNISTLKTSDAEVDACLTGATTQLKELRSQIENHLKTHIDILTENKELRAKLYLLEDSSADTDPSPHTSQDKSIIDEIRRFQNRVKRLKDQGLASRLTEIGRMAINQVEQCSEALQKKLSEIPDEPEMTGLKEETDQGLQGTKETFQAYADHSEQLTQILSGMSKQIQELSSPDNPELAEIKKALIGHIKEKIMSSEHNSEQYEAELEYFEEKIIETQALDDATYKEIKEAIEQAKDLESLEKVINSKLLSGYTDAIFEDKDSVNTKKGKDPANPKDKLDIQAKSFRVVEMTRKVLCDIENLKEKFIGTNPATSLQDVEIRRQQHSALDKIVRLCHSENLSHRTQKITPRLQRQLSNNVENTLKLINQHIEKLEWGGHQKTTAALKQRLAPDSQIVDSLTQGNPAISEKQADKASKILEKNPGFLNDFIWMVQRQKRKQAETHKGQSTLYEIDQGIDLDQQYLLSSEKMLNELCIIHGLTDKPAMPALLIALAKKTTDINSPVVGMLSERYSSEPGHTSGGGLRSEKFLQHCMTLLRIEEDHKQNSLFRGCPVDSSGAPIDYPHRAELDRFKDLTTCYFSVENPSKSNGQITGRLQPNTGLLGKYFSQAAPVTVIEQLAVGEKIISDTNSQPPLIFTQRKGANGQYGKLSVEILGSKKECDQRLYLTYPDYQSPFKVTAHTPHEDSIPLSDSLETGELLRFGNKSYYYKLVENISDAETANSKPVLKCVPISSENLHQETYEGAMIAWAACASSESNKHQLPILAKQAWQAYSNLKLMNSERTDETDFLDSAQGMIKKISNEQRHWFKKELNSRYRNQLKDSLDQYKQATASANTHNTALPMDYSGVKALAPDSLNIEEQRRKRDHRGTETADISALPTRRLPGDFDLQQEQYLQFMQEKLGQDHPSIKEILQQKRQERGSFEEEVFPEMLVLKNCQIKSSDNLTSISDHITALKRHYQFQKEESIGRLDDMKKLAPLILQLMPDDQKPCNLDDAKNYFANDKVSEQFAQKMMAYITLEASQKVAVPISDEIEKTIIEMEKLERNRTLMSPEQFKSEAHRINFKNFEIANRLNAMKERAQGLSIEKMDVENVSARLYEVFRGTQLRDYQIEPARQITELISKMASADQKGEGSETYRLNCQWGTGFGKTEMAKLYSMQACREGIGAIYIAPKENVDNFDIEMQRFANSQGSHYQRINIEQLTEDVPDWWTNEEQLDSVLDMVQGLPPHSHENQGNTLKKIPASMSTSDLQIILQLHQHFSQQSSSLLPHSQEYRSFQKLEKIVQVLSGTGLAGESKPFIIRDECDTLTDAPAITSAINKHLVPPLKSAVNEEAVIGLQLSHDISLTRAAFMSASQNTIYGAALQADVSAIKELQDKTNKHITTCEQRSERYLLDSKWLLKNKEDLNSTVEDALRFYDPEKDLIFCYPQFQSDNEQEASKNLAREGIKAFNAALKKGITNPIKGHLYFHNGEYYRYSEDDPYYSDYDQHTGALGKPLRKADEAEIRKTGGKGFITWMTEIRGYTAAQNKNTEFIFMNLPALSSGDMQQAIGRDRNNNPLRSYGSTITFSKKFLKDWNPEKGTSAETAKNQALNLWKEMNNARSMVNENSGPVKKLLTYKLTTTYEKTRDLKEQEEYQESSLNKAIDDYRKLCKSQGLDKAIIQQLVDFKIKEFKTISACKTAYMAMRVEKDFSPQQQKFEDTALQSKKNAEVVKLFRREKQTIDKECSDWIKGEEHLIKTAVQDAIDRHTDTSAPNSTTGKSPLYKLRAGTISAPAGLSSLTQPPHSGHPDDVTAAIKKKLVDVIKTAPQNTLSSSVDSVNDAYYQSKTTMEMILKTALEDVTQNLTTPSIQPNVKQEFDSACQNLSTKADQFMTDKIAKTEQLVTHITKTFNHGKKDDRQHLLNADPNGEGVKTINKAIKDLRSYQQNARDKNYKEFEEKIKAFYSKFIEGLADIEMKFTDLDNAFDNNDNVTQLFRLFDSICGTTSFDSADNHSSNRVVLRFNRYGRALTFKAPANAAYHIKIAATRNHEYKGKMEFLTGSMPSEKRGQSSPIDKKAFSESCFNSISFKNLIEDHTKAEKAYTTAQKTDQEIKDALIALIKGQLKDDILRQYSSQHQQLLKKAKEKDLLIEAQRQVMIAPAAA